MKSYYEFSSAAGQQTVGVVDGVCPDEMSVPVIDAPAVRWAQSARRGEALPDSVALTRITLDVAAGETALERLRKEVTDLEGPAGLDGVVVNAKNLRCVTDSVRGAAATTEAQKVFASLQERAASRAVLGKSAAGLRPQEVDRLGDNGVEALSDLCRAAGFTVRGRGRDFWIGW